MLAVALACLRYAAQGAQSRSPCRCERHPIFDVLCNRKIDVRTQFFVQVGVKPAGGIRTAKDAIKYLVLVNETAGEDWLDPRWFRLGASSLLNDLLMQRTKLATGRYSGPDYFTLD